MTVEHFAYFLGAIQRKGNNWQNEMQEWKPLKNSDHLFVCLYFGISQLSNWTLFFTSLYRVVFVLISVVYKEMCNKTGSISSIFQRQYASQDSCELQSKLNYCAKKQCKEYCTMGEHPIFFKSKLSLGHLHKHNANTVTRRVSAVWWWNVFNWTKIYKYYWSTHVHHVCNN